MAHYLCAATNMFVVISAETALFLIIYFSSDVQCGHLVASMLIVDLQYGHSFVVGFAGSSSFFFLGASNFFNTRNRTNAMIKKFTTAVMKLP